MRVGIVAPASRLAPETADLVSAVAQGAFGARVELVFHPQCFLSSGHFAGSDNERAAAAIAVANDPSIAAVWFARGGYGTGRIAARVLEALEAPARAKSWLGYSDAAYLLAGLYRAGYRVAHGPVPQDIRRDGGEAAIVRALHYLVDAAPETLEPSIDGAQPTAAFNLTILNQLVCTELMPDLTGHVLMLEEVSEHLYAIDRMMCRIVQDENVRRVAGIRLGRVSEIEANDPEFGQTPQDIVRHWCGMAGIRFLGGADIGHDSANKIVPFGFAARR